MLMPVEFPVILFKSDTYKGIGAAVQGNLIIDILDEITLFQRSVGILKLGSFQAEAEH